MTMILDKKYIGSGSYSLFLSNRFLRLYPMFWAVLLATVFVSILTNVFLNSWFKLSPYIQYFQVMETETLFFQIFTNIALLGQDIVMFLGISQETGGMYFTNDFRTSNPMFYKFLLVPQAWTLGIEVMFYLIAPFIVRRSNLFIALLITASMSIRVFIHFYLGYTNDPWTYRFFPSELALFLLGTISYRLYDANKSRNMTVLGIKLKYLVTYLFFLFLLFYPVLPKFDLGLIFNWLFYVLTCLSLPFIFELSKHSKLDARIGELSYPIYISHMLVIGCLSPILRMLGLQEQKGLMACIFTVIVSVLLVRLISDPIEKIRQSRVLIRKSTL
jgi:peptidoglycan/LPS O-acetylase OafA/YrhL